MGHVVTDLHVLDTLGEAKRSGPQNPAGLRPGAGDEQPRGEVECPLKRDGAPNVGGVAGAARFLDIAADRVELASEAFDVQSTEVGVCRDVGDGDVKVLGRSSAGDVNLNPRTEVGTDRSALLW